MRMEPLDVIVHGVLAQGGFGGDFLLRVACPDQPHNLPQPKGQTLARIGLGQFLIFPEAPQFRVEQVSQLLVPFVKRAAIRAIAMKIDGLVAERRAQKKLRGHEIVHPHLLVPKMFLLSEGIPDFIGHQLAARAGEMLAFQKQLGHRGREWILHEIALEHVIEVTALALIIHADINQVADGRKPVLERGSSLQDAGDACSDQLIHPDEHVVTPPGNVLAQLAQLADEAKDIAVIVES